MEGHKRCWEKVDESSRNEHTGSEMTGEEEEAVGNGKAGKAASSDGKGASYKHMLARHIDIGILAEGRKMLNWRVGA